MVSIEVENLVKQFGQFTAVDHISFSVNRGCIYGFLGPNGAGKSTTIRMLCGIMQPTSGKARVEGYDIEKNPDSIKKIIGYMSQKFSLYQDLTVMQNIEFYAGIHGIEQRRLKSKTQMILEMSHMKEFKNILARELSGGWKQHLALGCAVIHDPQVIFLDEPTAGVDPSTRKDFWKLIYEMSQQGKTIFVSTHYMNEAEYCGRIALIYGGQIIRQGSPLELKKGFAGRKFYSCRFSDNDKALKALKSKDFIFDVFHYGDVLHLAVFEDKIHSWDIQKILEGEGFIPLQMEEILPSMEDVFVLSIREKEGEA